MGNFYEGLMALAICLVDGELWGALDFLQRAPSVIPYFAYYMAAMSLGSCFVYTLQANYGALTVTTTTTVRKLISVLASVLWFGHQLQTAQWIATLVVFLAKPLSEQIGGALGWSAKKGVRPNAGKELESKTQ